MFETLKNYLVETLHVKTAEITMESKLVDDLGINSLDQADLAQHCEDEFNVTIPDEDLGIFITVGDVVRYLEEATKK